MPATTVWSVVALALLSLYTVGLVAVFVWWMLNGHPFPSSSGTNFPDDDLKTPYQASPVGFLAFGYVTAALVVAVVCIGISSIAWVASPRGQRMWPALMTGVSVAAGAVLVPAGAFAGFIVFFALPN